MHNVHGTYFCTNHLHRLWTYTLAQIYAMQSYTYLSLNAFTQICAAHSSWLPNQMISLVLIFGFLCRSSIFQYPDDLRNIVSTAMCYRRPRYRSSWPHLPVFSSCRRCSFPPFLILDICAAFWVKQFRHIFLLLCKYDGGHIKRLLVWKRPKNLITLQRHHLFRLFHLGSAVSLSKSLPKKNFHLCCRKLIESDHSRSCRVKWLSKDV